MNNEEIRQLLRQMSEEADLGGRSERIMITFDPPETEEEREERERREALIAERERKRAEKEKAEAEEKAAAEIAAREKERLDKVVESVSEGYPQPDFFASYEENKELSQEDGKSADSDDDDWDEPDDGLGDSGRRSFSGGSGLFGSLRGRLLRSAQDEDDEEENDETEARASRPGLTSRFSLRRKAYDAEEEADDDSDDTADETDEDGVLGSILPGGVLPTGPRPSDHTLRTTVTAPDTEAIKKKLAEQIAGRKQQISDDVKNGRITTAAALLRHKRSSDSAADTWSDEDAEDEVNEAAEAVEDTETENVQEEVSGAAETAEVVDAPEESESETEKDASELADDEDAAGDDADKEPEASEAAETAETEKNAADEKDAEQPVDESDADQQKASVKVGRKLAGKGAKALQGITKPAKLNGADRKTPVEPARFESDAADFRDDYAGNNTVKEPLTFRETMDAIQDKLDDMGISRKALFMIIAGIVLLILILVVVTSVLSSQHKMRNVTADDGLTVTVEDEPSAWTRSAEVTLGIKASSPIQSITVNGETQSLKNGTSGQTTNTQITFTATVPDLEVMVVSEQKVLDAQVVVPMIDSAAPDVKVSMDGETVTLEASDEGSGVSRLLYGVKESYSDVPFYFEYQAPFTAAEDKMYCYYAADNAGNIVVSEPSLMKEAKSLEISETDLVLFPGEKVRLDISAKPEKAYLGNLKVMSSNESVAKVTQDGTITAVSDGDAVIEVSADGLETVSCQVLVRSEAEITISAIGDCTLGDDVNFNTATAFSSYAATSGYDYFFQNVKDILSADDITFANLEGTLTEGGTRENKTYAFRGDPSYTQVLTSGSVEAVTLANNHSKDYGETSLTDTEASLDAAGIKWCNGDQIIIQETNGIKVGLIGIYGLDGTDKTNQIQSTIAEAKAQGAQIIVVYFHWGNESQTAPDSSQTSMAHSAIDYGADLVLGSHPHVMQGIEQYNGKYIAYSLGNFCFGGNNNPSDMDTMIYQQTFTLGQGGEITDTSVKITPCRISSTSTTNNYQPTPAVGDEATRIMDKINTLCEPFGTSF